MAAGMKWYFAYGSNMDAGRLFRDRLKPKGVAWGERLGGRLDGWRLTFYKQARTPPGAGAGIHTPWPATAGETGTPTVGAVTAGST